MGIGMASLDDLRSDKQKKFYSTLLNLRKNTIWDCKPVHGFLRNESSTESALNLWICVFFKWTPTMYHSLGFKDSKYRFIDKVADFTDRPPRVTYQHLSLTVSTLAGLEKGTLGIAYLTFLDNVIKILAGIELDAGATLFSRRCAVAEDFCRKWWEAT